MTPRENVKAAFPRSVRREARKTLKRALALFGPNGQRWTKRVEKTYIAGTPHFCAIGAIREADGPGEQAAMTVLGLAMSKSSKPDEDRAEVRIFSKNDEYSTTFPEIRRYFERAIEYLAD